MYVEGAGHLEKQIGACERGCCPSGSSVRTQNWTKEAPDSCNQFPF